MCPYPQTYFTEMEINLAIPETLLTVFTSGSTYQIQVGKTIVLPFIKQLSGTFFCDVKNKS